MTNNVTAKTKTTPSSKRAASVSQSAAERKAAAKARQKEAAKEKAKQARQRAAERLRAKKAAERLKAAEARKRLAERRKEAAVRERAMARERAAAARKKVAERKKAAAAREREAKRRKPASLDMAMTSSGRRRYVSQMMMESAKMAVDISQPTETRPLTGIDIEMWRQSMGLNIPKTSYALGIPSPNHYSKMANMRSPLPMGLEILIRLYEIDNEPPPWHPPEMRDLYADYYGEWVKSEVKKGGADILKSARIRSYSRFAALFGRSPYTSYRWIDDNDANAKPDVERIAGKISKMPNGKSVLEELAKRVWKLRGMDFDTLFPLHLDVR
jgi:chemotaxis protein histidine kinase CheA